MNTPSSVTVPKAVNQRHDGFSLLELMAVIAIVSVLLVISVPMYQTYAVRTKITSDIPLMHPLQLIMSEEFAVNNAWPETNEKAGARAPEHYKGQYLMSATISDDPQPGTMTLTYDEAELPVIRGTNTIVFYPITSNTGAQWACDKGTMPSKYRPPQCQ